MSRYLKETIIVMKQSKISIDEETHKMLRVYCVQRGLSMGQFVAKIVGRGLAKMWTKTARTIPMNL